MHSEIFLARLNTILSRQRSKILDEELETDFAILKRQREDESVPPKLYWALKSFPREHQVAYVKCLARAKEENCDKIRESVFLREQQTATLVLMEWAEHPSVDSPVELLNRWHDEAVEYDKKAGCYSQQIKSLCKKNVVQRAVRDCCEKVMDRKMRPVGESVFADSDSNVVGGARVIIERDCDGWSHFREEMGVEWHGRIAFVKQSICSWLGYFPRGTGGWSWILKDDLENAAHDAVQQTIQFREFVTDAVRVVVST